jgi:putative ABC transport system ATP-binding protein
MADDDYLDAVDYTRDDLDVEDLEEVQHAVRLLDVHRTFTLGKKEIVAVQGINLTVDAGDFVVISGKSGSGKTTLLNLIGAIDLPTSGRVFVMDVPINDYDESFRASFRLNNTGFIFQSYNLVSTLTAVENIMFPMQLSDKSRTELKEDALKLLENIGLDERVDHLPWQLSSGEQQRIAIARAIANDPPIILADEPTANLDGDSGQMIRELLTDLNKQGKAVIVMTHDEKIIKQPKAHCYRMKQGVLEQNV